MADKHTLAFEIGVEEIPAFDLDSANKQLEKMVPAAFADARIPYDSIEIHSSPRRLIVMAYGVADATEALVEEYKGPAAKIAFDADGNPTKAAIGFARGKGLSPENLERREVTGTEYVFATKNIPATPVADLLPDALAGFITAIKWPRSCRWAAYREYFVRPVRWIVAMLDDVVLPVSFAGAESSNFTMGHRVLAPGKHTVDTAANLLDVIRAAYVIPTQAERERIIREGVAAIEAETGFTADLPAKTLLEVVNLSEYPQPLVSTFDEEFLQVPEEIIVDAMLMHQRYFPLYDAAGKLTNKFIIVSNGNPECAATIIDGNERVVRARLDDAKFFYEEDLKISLDEFRERLAKVAFQEKLGSVLAKSERIEQLALAIAREAHLGAHLAADAARAAHLCKADLVSNAVVEFTSQQGVMGGYYATAMGENDEVAHAIRDHYRPRFAGDELPEGTAGCIVACADKLDTIAGIFAIGEPPTGSSDPYALRRAAIGIINILRDRLPIDPTSLIDFALELYSEQGIEFDAAEVAQQVRDFFHGRLVSMARDEKIPADTVAAVSAVHIIAPSVFFARCAALDEARKNDAETFDNLATAYARAAHISKPELGAEYDRSLMGEVELALADASEAAQTAVDAALAAEDYPAAFAALAALRAPIDRFFDEVMVMDKDEQLRDNRLKLLNRFEAVFSGIANIGELARKK